MTSELTLPGLPAGKVCCVCKIWKEAIEFYRKKRPDGTFGLRSDCIKCACQWQREHTEESKLRQRERRKTHPRQYTQRSYDIQLNPLDAAWLAGIIDGEGSICIGVTRPSAYNHKKQNVYRATMAIGMSHKPTIDRIYSILGVGRIHITRDNNPKWSTMYQWSASALQAEAVLNAVYPYLFTKKADADLFIEFCKLPKWKAAFDPEVQKMRYEYWVKMAELKGPASTRGRKYALRDTSE